MMTQKLRILVNDHSGHPFQVQLSRSLAQRGHTVLHTYSTSFQTPKGPLSKRSTDPDTFDVRGISLSKPFEKYSFVRRRSQEREYAARLSDHIGEFRPDVILCSNTPLDAQSLILEQCKRRNSKFIFWVQDIYSIAIKKILDRKLPIIGYPIGLYYEFLERRQLRESDAIVLITDDFLPLLDRWGIRGPKRRVIPNWAPLDELVEKPKSNSWSQQMGIHNKIVIMYSGTLGMKHNPEILLKMAEHFRPRGDVCVVVISEGLGANWLGEKKRALGLDNLLLLKYQPFERLSEVLSSADIFVTILEPDAGVFSVPSKVLTYMCFQRPQVLAVPRENLSARIVEGNNAGRIVSPKDIRAILHAVEELVDNPALRQTIGLNSFGYAQKHFDIRTITDSFERILAQIYTV